MTDQDAAAILEYEAWFWSKLITSQSRFGKREEWEKMTRNRIEAAILGATALRQRDDKDRIP